MEENTQRHMRRLLHIIPVALLLASLAIMASSYVQTGDIFIRSIELRGGTLITVSMQSPPDISAIEGALSGFSHVSVRELRSFSGYGITIEAAADADTEAILQAVGSAGVDTRGSTIEKVGPSLGASFWAQAQAGIISAFIAMAVIVFFIFRTYIPSLAVILAGTSTIIITIASMLVLNIELSLASLAAILTLIGYSVDTDILLTTKVLRDPGTIDERERRARKTGLTMTLTSLGAATVLYLSSVSQVTNQIAIVLIIGLLADMVNTWIQNAGILRWYAARKGVV